MSDFFNDVYLKLSGVKDGTANYSDPSYVTDKEIIVDDKPVTVKQITYSDTAKMLIENGLTLLA